MEHTELRQICRCPQCGGPVMGDDGFARCEAGHQFSSYELLLEATRVSAHATWIAVRALEDRERAVRWGLTVAHLETPSWLADSALADGQTARLLRNYAHAIDENASRLADAGRKNPGEPFSGRDRGLPASERATSRR
jgi:hypothetical protein